MDDTTAKPELTRGMALLERVAEALDCPVEAFTDRSLVPRELADKMELLRLWTMIEDPQNRQRLLRVARDLAGQ